MVTTKSYTEPQICKKEILRYTGCKEATPEIEVLVDECLKEVLPRLSYKVCYTELSLNITEDICDFEHMKVKSKDLVKNLQGCEKVILFTATIGVEIDRLITKYSHISPSKALMFQATGTERIEALCDVFCEELENERGKSLHPRFSPGYGDLPIEIQKEIFRLLGCSKSIGVTLNDSLLMSPSKSVTAFVGIGLEKESQKNENKCAACEKTDCAYRGI